MIKAITIAVLLMAASSTARITPKIVSQDIYDTMLHWKLSLNSSSSAEKPRDNIGSICCPINGLSQVTGIPIDQAEYLASNLAYYGEVVLSAESCTLVDCTDQSAGMVACNFNSYDIEVPGSTLGDFTDFLASACSPDETTCGVGLDYTVNYNVWTEENACSS